jgi:hypothetical protein
MPSGPSRAGGAVKAGASAYLAVVTSRTAILQPELEAGSISTLAKISDRRAGTRQAIAIIWRARKDSNSRPPLIRSWHEES